MLDTIRLLVVREAVRFVKYSWLQDVALRGGLLRRRQETPEKAFWSANDVLQGLEKPDCRSAAFVAVSYGWLSPEHPDPRGQHLAAFCRAQPLGAKFVFWDFVSLHQYPRSHREDTLFSDALSKMHCFYASKLLARNGRNCWGVCRLMDVPEGHANSTPYSDRGWTTFESQVALAGGPWVISMEGGVLTSTPEPVPMLPEVFEQLVQQKQFTSKKADVPVVVSLYSEVWARELSQVQEMIRWHWTDREADAFRALLSELPHLQKLQLCRWSGTDEIRDALSQACAARGIIFKSS